MEKVLIVDDDDTVRTTLKRVLIRDDLDVTLACSAKEGLEILKKEEFQLIITDVKMPEMDGITFLKKAKTDKPEIPVVVLTGFATIEMTRDALQNGAYNFLTKPFEIEDIKTIVRRGLNLKKDVIRNKEVAKFTKCIFDIDIPNKEELLNGVMFIILEQLKLQDFNQRVMSTEILMALDEALTNAFKHGNKKDPGKKIIIHTEADNEKTKIIVRDEGDGFAPDKLINPLSAEGMEKNCGRGVFLIKSYMDEVSYNDRGNELSMMKFNRR